MIILNEKDVILQEIVKVLNPYMDYEMENTLREQIPKILEPFEIKVKEETSVAKINNNNEELLRMFQINRKGRLSDQTIRQYSYTIKDLMKFYNKSLLILQKKDIELYLSTYLEESKCSTASINTRKNFISAFYVWLKNEGLVEKNPCEGIENYKVVKKPVEFLTATEWDTLKSGCTRPRDRALLEFLRSTAMRVGEIIEVRINDINWQTGEITIFGSKTQKYRTVYLDTIAMKYIEEYLTSRGVGKDSGDYLFVREHYNKQGVREQLSTVAIERDIKAIGERAGMNKRIYPHLFRKTTATNIIKRGGSEAEAGMYLGHTPSSVTGKHYIGDNKDEIEKIFKKSVAIIQ